MGVNYMKTIIVLLTISLQLLSHQIFSQVPDKPKQCFSFADWVNPETGLIENKSIEEYVCVKFIDTYNFYFSYGDTTSYKYKFDKVEFLEKNEFNYSTFRGTLNLNNNKKIVIVYISNSDGRIMETAFLQIHYIKKNGVDYIIQYKVRN
jgi:hypothetical protein